VNSLVITVINDIKSIFKTPYFLRYLIYRFKYPHLALSPATLIKGNVVLEENINIGKSTQLIGSVKIGRNSSINENCKLFGDVEIGDNCLLSNNIFISSGGHIYNKVPSLPIKEQDTLDTINKKVIIENDCWIGINVVIMAGVTIGKGSIIGANSVVVKNVNPYSVIGGVPAKLIKKRINFTPTFEIDSSKVEDLPYFYNGFLVREYEKKRYGVYEGLLTKKNFSIILDCASKNELFIELKCYKKLATLTHRNQSFLIDNSSFKIIKVNINSDKLFYFSSSEPIIIKRFFI